MNILMVTMGMGIGGAETHIIELCRALTSRGVLVSVASAGGAACSDKAEVFGAADARRTFPPHGISACSVMLILNLAVPCRVIGILFKIVRLLRCGGYYCAKYLIFP